MKKTLLFLMVFGLLWGLSLSFAHAQDSEESVTPRESATPELELVEVEAVPVGSEATIGLTAEEAVAEPEVTAADLDIKKPGKLWWLKNFFRRAQVLITRNPVKKAEIELKIANTHLLRVKTAAVEQVDDEKLKARLEKMEGAYEKATERLNARLENIDQELPEAKKFLDKFTDHQFKHQEVLKKLEENLPEKVVETIRVNRERHLKKFGEVMNKVQSKEEFRERIQNVLENQKDKIEHRVRRMEIVDELQEKAPTEVKAQIRKVKEERKELFQDLKVKREELKQNRLRTLNEVKAIRKDGREDIKSAATPVERKEIRQETKEQVKDAVGEARETNRETKQGIRERVKESVQNAAAKIKAIRKGTQSDSASDAANQ